MHIFRNVENWQLLINIVLCNVNMPLLFKSVLLTDGSSGDVGGSGDVGIGCDSII